MAETSERKYELVLIYAPELSAKQVEEELKSVKSLLKSKSVKKVDVDDWGKRQIAFNMNKKKNGTYVSLKFVCSDPTMVEFVTSNLRIVDKLLKFQFHRINEKTRKFKGNPLAAKKAQAKGAKAGSVAAYT